MVLDKVDCMKERKKQEKETKPEKVQSPALLRFVDWHYIYLLPD